MKIIDLSQTLYDDMPVYPGDPPCKIAEIHTLAKEGWRLKYMEFSTHIGTHVDAFSHMSESGESIEKIPLDKFIGRTVLVSLEEDFPQNLGLAFKDGNLEIAHLSKFLKAAPTFVVVGNTAILSVELERALLENGVITITDLVNMESLPNSEFTLYAIPLKIKDGDGSPVRAFAVID